MPARKKPVTPVVEPEKPQPEAQSPAPTPQEQQPQSYSHTQHQIAIQLPHFQSSEYLVNDIFQASSRIPVTSESDYNRIVETIKGQARSVGIAQENLSLNRQLLKAEGLSLDCQSEGLSNQIKLQDLKTTGVKLLQSQTRTGIEQSKLSELKHDLNGHEKQAELRGQTWQLKLTGLSDGISEAHERLKAARLAVVQEFPEIRLSPLPVAALPQS
jgi:hypothetical protein